MHFSREFLLGVVILDGSNLLDVIICACFQRKLGSLRHLLVV
jgi:hypothetical protein